MQLIPISLAAPGMVLCREVRRSDNPDGPPICGRGVELTASLLERLRRMGVETVFVEGRPVHVEGEATLEEMLAALELRFRKVEADPRMQRLKEICRGLIHKSMGDDCGRQKSGNPADSQGDQVAADIAGDHQQTEQAVGKQ